MSEKVMYWNMLRKKLNIYILFVMLILIIVRFGVHGTIGINILWVFLVYFSVVNFPLLIIELIDRQFNFKEQKRAKKIFKVTMFFLVFFGPFVYNFMSLTNFTF